jgi:hypothetical protein
MKEIDSDIFTRVSRHDARLDLEEYCKKAKKSFMEISNSHQQESAIGVTVKEALEVKDNAGTRSLLMVKEGLVIERGG